MFSIDLVLVWEFPRMHDEQDGLPKVDVCPFVPELLSDGYGTLVHEAPIPTRSCGNAGGKDTDTIRPCEAGRSVREAQAVEPEASDRADAANTGQSWLTIPSGDQSDLLTRGKLRHEIVSLPGCFIPC